MINISTYKKDVVYSHENSILIIGPGSNEYKNKEIIKASSLETVKYNYGDSPLYNAFKESYNIGAQNIFLCNCFKFTDYIDIIETIKKNDFLYIVPLFNFSETFTINNDMMYLCEFYSNILYDSNSQIFVTDKHASLYDNLDNFVIETNKVINDFKDISMSRMVDGSNLCFILNNLKEYNFANVALASILSLSDLKEYPHMNIGDVIYDLNNFDFYGQEVAYFSYDSISKTTIENFLNFNKENSPEKFVPVNIIKQVILKSLDLSEYKGKLFTPYMRISLENKINTIMNKHVSTLIENYNLLNINMVKNNDYTISIYVYLSFKPYNSIEELNITLEM